MSNVTDGGYKVWQKKKVVCWYLLSQHLAFHKGIIKIELEVRTLGVLSTGTYIHRID